MLDTDTEFEIAGFAYRAAKMHAMQQWNVVRRLAPLLGSFKGLAEIIKLPVQEDGVHPELDLNDSNASAAIEAAGKAIASLSDQDSDFIIAACMMLCERRKDGGPWVKIWNVQAGRPISTDIHMGVMLRITCAVLKGNLSGFFPEFRSILSGETTAQSTMSK